jgi:hypothetical protein
MEENAMLLWLSFSHPQIIMGDKAYQRIIPETFEQFYSIPKADYLQHFSRVWNSGIFKGKFDLYYFLGQRPSSQTGCSISFPQFKDRSGPKIGPTHGQRSEKSSLSVLNCWCRMRGLNPRPSVYKTAALPLS